MTLVVDKTALHQILKCARWTLMVCAASMLGYCGYVLVDAWTFQMTERRQFDQLLQDRQVSPVSFRNPLAVVAGGLIGRIEIERLGMSAMVMEGTKTSTLRRAVGHIRGTALPGQRGNAGIAGHRDTFFRPLRNVQQNDIITLTTPLSAYRYRVVSARVVDPEEVSVLETTNDEILTLVTCYPFYYVGAAPSRFVVRAERL